MAIDQSLGVSSTAFRKKFRSAMTVRSFRDNEIIFSQGDKADAVFYIQSGTVKLTSNGFLGTCLIDDPSDQY